jgi:hypothetical protein
MHGIYLYHAQPVHVVGLEVGCITPCLDVGMPVAESSPPSGEPESRACVGRGASMARAVRQSGGTELDKGAKVPPSLGPWDSQVKARGPKTALDHTIYGALRLCSPLLKYDSLRYGEVNFVVSVRNSLGSLTG